MTAYVKVRNAKTKHARTGKLERYYVYYRLGPNHKERYAGSFPTKLEAQRRRDIIAGEIAALRDPAKLLAEFNQPPVPADGLEQVWDRFIESRVDVGVKAQAQYRNARDRWLPILGPKTPPIQVTPDHVIAGIAELADDLAPSTVQQYTSNLGMVLDFADVVPNPVRSPKVKLPAQRRGEREIPTGAAWLLICARIKRRSRLAVRLMEACALRVSEACHLEWGDVDFQAGMIRIRREATKTAAGRRWVPVPPGLLHEIDGLQAVEDRRTDGRVLCVKQTEVAYDLDRACVLAGVAEFGTHALRHRRISLWIRLGIDAKQASLWAGHAKPTETMNTYAHQVNPGSDEWAEFWVSVYSGRSVAHTYEEAQQT